MARSMDSIKTNIDSIGSLTFISKCLGILPFNINNVEKSRCRYFYPLMMISIFIAINTFSAFGKIQLREVQESTVEIIDIMSDLALTASNIASVIGINILKGRDLCTFLNNLRAVDNEFSSIKHDYVLSHMHFIIELALYHILFFLYYIYNIYIWTTSIGIEIYKNFIVRDLQYYDTIILSLLLRYYALAIKFRFEILNQLIQKINQTQDSGSMIQQDLTSNYGDAEWSMRKIMQIYTKLSIIVDQYNNIFGWQYVVLYIVIVINLLMPLNMALVYGSGEKMMYGAKFGVEFIVLCIFWSCIPVFMARALFTAGEQGSAEASSTANICYTMVHELSTNPKDLVLKEELLELAHQASIKAPQFSAAGFFSIDFTILFSLVGSISSYLIVLIQFNK